jgi:hypothetical protein
VSSHAGIWEVVFQLRAGVSCHFLFLEKKKVTKENSRKNAKPPAAFFRPTPLQSFDVWCFPF